MASHSIGAATFDRDKVSGKSPWPIAQSAKAAEIPPTALQVHPSPMSPRRTRKNFLPRRDMITKKLFTEVTKYLFGKSRADY